MNQRDRLAESQQHELCSILLLGCDRTTAMNYLGLTPSALGDELRRDAAFARRVLRAEATAELHHMRNVHHAAKDEKNWRTSVWWLERRAPERFGRRDGQAISAAQLEQAIDEAARAIIEEVANPEERRRVVDRLRDVVASVLASPSAGPAQEKAAASREEHETDDQDCPTESCE